MIKPGISLTLKDWIRVLKLDELFANVLSGFEYPAVLLTALDNKRHIFPNITIDYFPAINALKDFVGNVISNIDNRNHQIDELNADLPVYYQYVWDRDRLMTEDEIEAFNRWVEDLIFASALESEEQIDFLEDVIAGIEKEIRNLKYDDKQAEFQAEEALQCIEANLDEIEMLLEDQ